MLRFCAEAFRRNLLPGLALQAIGVAIVLAYYCWPAAKGFYDAVTDLKNSGGFLFSGASTCLFGGIVPFAFMFIRRQICGDYLRLAVFFMLFWFWRGMETDAFYRLQAFMFGHGTDWLTIMKKVLFDQFVYTAFWVSPLILVIYSWKDSGFSISRAKQTLGRDFLTFRLPAFILPTWAVWIPTVAIIYCLPAPLQLPLFSVELCFWSLVLCLLADSAKTG